MPSDSTPPSPRRRFFPPTLLLLWLWPASVPVLAEPAAERPAYAPTSAYESRDVLGWKVLFHRDLLAEERLFGRVEQELRTQLYNTTRVIPAGPLAKLKEIPIWVELFNPRVLCACYHPSGNWLRENGFNPAKARAIEIGNARNFVSWTRAQPWMVLHELAHGYHDRYLEDGYRNKEILAAFERAKASGIYEEVLRYNGTTVRHYALNNPMEYFAEATEAYFGMNDYFPFNYAELVAFDPAGAEMIERVWQVDRLEPSAGLPEPLPWNLAALGRPPAMRWGREADGVREVFFWSEPFGETVRTEVFAYYASPGTLRGDETLDENLPGIVLVHGGGGGAFSDWARQWAKRGYAAIAVDYAGRGPGGGRLADGGPDQGDRHKFAAIDEPLTEQWTYHAVANTLRAHSLLRSLPEVDASRTAITGISWGGYLTCIAAGLDHRFAAAVPVYGCGFLQDGSKWENQFARMTPEQRERWHTLWDPSRYVGAARMPMFFVNGTNDAAYWIPSYVKTYGLVAGERNLRVTVRMPHSHAAGWEPQEIALFVEQHLRGGTPLPRFEAAGADPAGGFGAAVVSETAIERAEFHYTTETGRWPRRTWQSRPAEFRDGTASVSELPEGTAAWFFTVGDERQATVSSEVVLVKPE